MPRPADACGHPAGTTPAGSIGTTGAYRSVGVSCTTSTCARRPTAAGANRAAAACRGRCSRSTGSAASASADASPCAHGHIGRSITCVPRRHASVGGIAGKPKSRRRFGASLADFHGVRGRRILARIAVGPSLMKNLLVVHASVSHNLLDPLLVAFGSQVREGAVVLSFARTSHCILTASRFGLGTRHLNRATPAREPACRIALPRRGPAARGRSCPARP